MEKLLRVAALYENKLRKIANPSDEQVKSLIKNTVESLKDTYEDDLEGVLYASHVQPQHNTDYSYVHFILNIDQDEQAVLANNQNKRYTIIQNGVLNSLNSTFKMNPWKLKFTEVFAKNPGWFGEKYD